MGRGFVLFLFLFSIVSYGEGTAKLSIYEQEEKIKIASLIKLKILIYNKNKNYDEIWKLRFNKNKKWITHGPVLINTDDLEGDSRKSIILKALVLSADAQITIAPISIENSISGELRQTNELSLQSSSRISSKEKAKWFYPLMDYGGWNFIAIFCVTVLILFFLFIVIFYIKKILLNRAKEIIVDRKKETVTNVALLIKEIKNKPNLTSGDIKRYSYKIIYFIKVYFSEIFSKNLLDFTDKELKLFLKKKNYLNNRVFEVEKVLSETYEVRYSDVHMEKENLISVVELVKSMMDKEEKKV